MSALQAKPPAEKRSFRDRLPSFAKLAQRFEGRERMGRVRRFWLSLVARGWVVRGFVLPLIPVILVRLLLIPLQSRDGTLTLIGGVLLDIAVFLAGLLFVEWSRYWGLAPMMVSVKKLARMAQVPNKEFCARLAAERIAQTYDTLNRLLTASITVPNPDVLADFFAGFFRDGGLPYLGIDSHLPSEYIEQYSWYLALHESNLDARDGSNNDVRIIVASSDDLTTDYLRSRERYLEFYKWHLDNDVTVKWISPDEIETMRHRFGIPIAADVGFWKHHAVLFTPETDGQMTLSLRITGEDARDSVSYREIERFVMAVNDAAIEFTDGPPDLEMVSERLAAEWESYLDPYARERGPFGRFLLEELKGRQYVLDAAAGIGAESVFLLKNDYTVFSNEVDARLAAVATRYAAHNRVKLNLSGYLWERLPELLEGNMKFDAVLVVGNSLCLVKDEARRTQCVEVFRSILNEDGVLVIDERNFDAMIRKRDAIMKNPLREFRPAVHGDVMYRGRKVRGYPVTVSQDLVTWRFFRNSPPPRRLKDLHAARLPGPDLKLYPFRHGELFDLLREVGFSSIDVFGDLNKLSEGGEMPSREAVANADFITYIAHK